MNIKKDINDIQKHNMIEYMTSVMEERAIADTRDGLKPVQRYIIWNMIRNGNTHNKPHVKSAAVVGLTIADFSPHGDASTYDALARMTQKFSLNQPLLDPHGSFGSINGDTAAAMRYTEIRLDKFTDICMESINKNAVDFVPNYDNSKVEPTVLPFPICNLLINGSYGIACGFAQAIPPHNLTDVCNLTKTIIDNPDISDLDVAKQIKPDFPTGGIICNTDDINKAYIDGKGSFKLRAKVDIKENKNGTSEIIIKEIPFQVTVGPRMTPTASSDGGLINSIVKKIKDGTIDGIADILDYSKGMDINIILKIKKGFDPNVVLNKLYKYTLLETTQKIIFVCNNNKIFDNNYSIKRILTEFIDFRIKTIRRTIIFDIDKLNKRNHIIDGLITALNDIDNVIKIIKTSNDKTDCKDKLKSKYSLTEIQVDAILSMKLSSLMKLEVNKLKDEKKEIVEKLKTLKNDLKEENIKNKIKEEQDFFIKNYGRERLTQLENINTDIDEEDIMENEETTVIITNENYIKRTNNNFKVQKRNTKGINIDDDIKNIFNTNTKDHLLCFTNKGRVYDIKVHNIKECNLKSKGIKIENILKLRADEIVNNILCIDNENFNNKESQLVFLTKKGYIKRTSLELFNNINSSGIIALSMKEHDELISVKYVESNNNNLLNDVILSTKTGQVVRYVLSDIPDLKRDTMGSTAIKLSDDDNCIGLEIIKDINDLVFFGTKNGLGKCVRITDMVKKKDPNTKKIVDINDGFPVLKRSATIKGRLGIRLNDNDEVVSMNIINIHTESFMIVTNNKFVNIEAKEFVEPLKRPAFGKKMINLDENDYVKLIVSK